MESKLSGDYLKPWACILGRFYNGPVRSAPTVLAIVCLGLSVTVGLGIRANASSPPSDPAPHGLRDCAQAQLLANGRPTMIPLRDHAWIGISLAQRKFKTGEPIELHIWVDNRGSAPAGVFTCMDLERFRTNGIAVFAQDGDRVLSQDEERARKECAANPQRPTQWGLWVCARNILLKIPAHTCVTHNDYDFEYDLTSQYRFPPGKYAIRLQRGWQRGVNLCAQKFAEPSPPRRGDLLFTVANP